MKKPETLIGATVRLIPQAAAYWREYRDGTLMEHNEDAVVVAFSDGTKLTVPMGDVDFVGKAPASLVEDWIGGVVAGDDEPA